MEEESSRRKSGKAVRNVWTDGGLFPLRPGSYALNTGFPCVAFVVYSLRMLLVEPLYTWLPYIPVVSPIYGQGRQYRSAPDLTAAILAHTLSGSVVLLCGALQFDKSLRRKYPTMHRWSGRLYVVSGCIMIYSLQVLRRITGSGSRDEPSMSMQAIIDICTVLWFVTIAAAVFHILRGDVQRHRQYMLRNFLLSFAPVIQRLINSVLSICIFVQMYPLFIIINFIFGSWDTGEWIASLNGLGRLQEMMFPWSSWGGLILQMSWAEYRIMHNKDLWVEAELWPAVTPENDRYPNCCKCWYKIHRRLDSIGATYFSSKELTTSPEDATLLVTDGGGDKVDEGKTPEERGKHSSRLECIPS